MHLMKKLMGAALAAGATMISAGAAHAEVTANVALTTDYVFRGVSLSGNDPAIQGGADWSSDMFYAGVWASSLSEGMELDAYVGVTPTTGPVTWDLGLIGYFYPGADDDGAEFDYYELMVGAGIDVTEQVNLGAAVFYSDDNYGNTGEATYYELNGSFAITDAFAIDAAYGNQTIENPDGVAGGALEGDYNTWNIGAGYAFHGFTLDLRYHDTDIDEGSDIEWYTYGPSSYDSAVVFTIGREL
jgi:uncharacterized protein (TIGR02001 family)